MTAKITQPDPNTFIWHYSTGIAHPPKGAEILCGKEDWWGEVRTPVGHLVNCSDCLAKMTDKQKAPPPLPGDPPSPQDPSAYPTNRS